MLLWAPKRKIDDVRLGLPTSQFHKNNKTPPTKKVSTSYAPKLLSWYGVGEKNEKNLFTSPMKGGIGIVFWL